MRRLASFVLCLACAAVARAQTPPAAPDQPAASSGVAATESPAAAAPAAEPAAPAPAPPAPAAYQPAVLGEPKAPPAEAPAAAAPSGHFPQYRPGRSLSPEERAQLVEARAALLRDRRAEGKPQWREEQPVRHGDSRARWTLAISLDSVFYTDHGYDFFDDNNVAQRLGVWAGFDIAQLDPRTSLAVELGIGAESQEQGTWQGALNTELESQTAAAGLSLRYAMLPWLDPQARVSGGATRFEFQLDTSDNETYEDSAVSGFAALGAGLLFHTPSRTFENRNGQFASVGFGLLVEGGYALRQSIELTPERRSPKHAIPITQARLGELPLSGPYVRTSVLVRF